MRKREAFQDAAPATGDAAPATGDASPMSVETVSLELKLLDARVDATITAVSGRINEVAEAVAMTCDTDTSSDTQMMGLPLRRLRMLDSLRRGAPDVYAALLTAADRFWKGANTPNGREALCKQLGLALGQSLGVTPPAPK